MNKQFAGCFVSLLVLLAGSQKVMATDYELISKETFSSQNSNRLTTTQVSTLYKDCLSRVSPVYCNDLFSAELTQVDANTWVVRERQYAQKPSRPWSASRP